MEKVFNTDKRIRLGIWGLGRGGNFVEAAKVLNIDVVAGCDQHGEIRERFRKIAPEAWITDNEDDFLAGDFDAVLIATYLPDHARHTIKALEAGKHVMCEVTAFQTPADGVKVVEAVEKSGKIYNMLENYPFTPSNMYMQKLYSEGFFGELQYGEFEYVHECRRLAYSYNSYPTIAVEPGYGVHHWRSRLNFHYYCTHSLGPAMYITNLRPVGVSAVADEVTFPGLLYGVKSTATPSFVKMSNGSLVRNLMGHTSNDYHSAMRFWGTRAGAERMHNELKIRIGGAGSFGLLMDIEPELNEIARFALNSGHGGGDFWELYFFAREILTGEPSPWNVYASADVTLAGIMAIRSEKLNGTLVEIPDFRIASVRDKYRNDHEIDLPDFDPADIFPAGHDPAISGRFSPCMTALYCNFHGLTMLNNALDGMKIYADIKNPEGKVRVRDAVNGAIRELPEIRKNCLELQKILEAYPDSIPGRTVAGLFEALDMEKILNAEKTIEELKAWQISVVNELFI